jgi:hypothetical protein
VHFHLQKTNISKEIMYQRSSSTPIRPVSLIENPQKNPYQQPWTPGPISSPTILPFELGSTIDDPVRGSSYNLIQPLGNGSYAVVYMVRNKKDNKYYALKCLSKENLSDYHLSIQHNEVISVFLYTFFFLEVSQLLCSMFRLGRSSRTSHWSFQSCQITSHV